MGFEVPDYGNGRLGYEEEIAGLRDEVRAELPNLTNAQVDLAAEALYAERNTLPEPNL